LDRQGDDAPQPSLGDLAGRIAEAGRAAVAAEIGLWKAIAAWRLGGLKLGLPAFILALFIAQALATALFVVLAIALAPLVGVFWAVLILMLVGLGLIGALVWFGLARLRTLIAPLPPRDPQP
jgi:hypothetical protein